MDTEEVSLELDIAAALEDLMGYYYRAEIGKLVYAYVIFRPDIGYAITKLAGASNRPAACHYQAVKRIFKYLCHTK